jgi:phospholipase C
VTDFISSFVQPIASYSTRKRASISSIKSVVKGAGSTHSFCTHQALVILENDGFTKAANVFSYFLTQLDSGVTWADKGFKSIYHYYNPDTKQGKYNLMSAAELCDIYMDKAIKLWKNKKHSKAMFYLGAASHLVQDMCVPHHAYCTAAYGHHYFEKWAEQYKEDYKVDGDGIYMAFQSASQWIHLNALYSKNYFDFVKSENSEEDYHLATSVLLPRAQRTTSGFWLNFYRLIIE